MDTAFTLADTSSIITPALLVFPDRIEANINRMIAYSHGVSRLRPHCKTHKLGPVTELELARGITKHKCATIAEAEMLARAGVLDVFLAYNIVGANIPRVVAFRKQFPHCQLRVQADHPGPVRALGMALAQAGETVDVLLDLDVGMRRTGIEIGSRAIELYELIAATPGLTAGGLHVYDGHLHQSSVTERTTAVEGNWPRVRELKQELMRRGLPVPRIVCGGTNSFAIFASLDDPLVEVSPGTPVFYDAGYTERYADLDFPPAAALLTRVISRPAVDRLTVDLGNKAVASDPPMGQRVIFPALPDAQQVTHSEEHLVLQTPRAEEFQPGDELIAIPRHICPTVALHKAVWVIRDGRLVDRWDVTARDRWITI